MTYITKKTVIIFFLISLNSCSSITNSVNNADYFFKSLLRDDLVDDDIYQAYEYSFISVKNTNFNHAYLVLKEFKEGLAVWVDSEGNEIITNNYRVSATNGLRRNMSLKMSKYSYEVGEHNGYYNFYNPDATNLFFRSHISSHGSDDINYMGKRVQAEKLEEVINIVGTNTVFKNTYWINNKNQVLKSIQKYHPFANPLRITFYYKYNY